ncbi:LamG-like jellyroll fold domain-containing protein [Sphingomonas sp.]|uniref:glycosyl hydrolase 2 galactose-binding domain-containing protein n=1 Tax=Sphingomonas sp. TaxID=28214 RepID=UPI000DB31A22|nr:LamG-like jellyroll fold domain-containing protein [Sphingomonas sp.]PZU10974.1 MAG: glycoside hydrolase family 2 [Sphingomonas sp.]
MGRNGASAIILALLATTATARAQSYGPINAELPAGGEALKSAIGGADAAPIAAREWTLSAWIEPSTIAAGPVLIGGFGDPLAGPRRYLSLDGGRPGLVTEGGTLSASRPLPARGWHHIAVSFDGTTAHLYLDGRPVAQRAMTLAPVPATAMLAPRTGTAVFAGRVAAFTLDAGAADARAIKAAASRTPDPALIAFKQGSPRWPGQIQQMYGQITPQDAATRPASKTPFGAPVARPEPAGPAIVATGPGTWDVARWRLAEAPRVSAPGASLSRPGFDARTWYEATVPGTVLTTLVDRGVYPDPAHGLNNLAIPEGLARQDYWYRSEFDAPAEAAGKRQFLTFNGINYAAEIWVNGQRIGTMKGAFIRGRFDVTDKLVPGRNAIAVKVSPPPHPGVAHEESLTAGVGENGGAMMLDGPTFGATEGWDWIPSIRDRNTGLWQGVTLSANGDATLGDPQVVTSLPRADNSIAEIEITAPVTNMSDAPVTATVRASFDDVTVEKQVTLAPGQTNQAVFRPAEFAQLAVRNPKLWWPNGYGDPALHTLTLTASIAGQTSDTRQLRFGMRQVTYDISLMDQKGELERVGVDLTKARALGQQIVDGSHEGIRKVTGGWAASLLPGAENSAAVHRIAGEDGLSPHLVIRVNGVRIAARGGNIGMDDFMKRVDRARLEPFFRLHQDAHLNIIRNWVGQNTEDAFYDLADEYGLMVLNDFWESTQDYNVEAQDPELFLKNAADVVKRYRNHPSIVVWFGRNEGVPQPILNEGLQALIHEQDGTRLYMGSSNRVNLQNSGPYNWRPPVEYFTEHARGFSVESGTPSLPTLEAWKRAIPAPDRWPISDTWAYHDWHQTGNGAVTSYMNALAARFGPGTSLEDFERKAQMMQYESYRAIFEGMNAGLWTVNSGRMLWMTQPAWPSSTWQIFSSDYDTQASFYGVKKASEPLHVQMNLPDYKVILVNNRSGDLSGVRVRAKVVSLDNRLLAEKEVSITAKGEAASPAFTLDLAPILASGVALVRLEAADAAGTLLSTNFYWQAGNDAQFRALNSLAPVTLASSAVSRIEGDETVSTVTLINDSATPAIEAKLTVMNADGTQILPAYFTDNYVSLLPGETRTVEIRYPTAKAATPSVTLRGWNVTGTSKRLN